MNSLLRLERYTEKNRQEVLLVTATNDGEPEQIVVFRGFSSSLTRATAFDPDVPLLAADAVIERVDRLVGPYNPNQLEYLQQDLSAVELQALFAEADV